MILWTWGSSPLSPELHDDIRAEVARLTLPGFANVLIEEGPNGVAQSRDLLVNVRITGECNANDTIPADKRAPLGYVIESDGRINRNMFVSCQAILNAIRPFVLEQPMCVQNGLLARAIVRVIRHELRHIIEQTADHLKTGLFKAQLQPKDLVCQ